jgi:hypothetical protein
MFSTIISHVIIGGYSVRVQSVPPHNLRFLGRFVCCAFCWTSCRFVWNFGNRLRIHKHLSSRREKKNEKCTMKMFRHSLVGGPFFIVGLFVSLFVGLRVGLCGTLETD